MGQDNLCADPAKTSAIILCILDMAVPSCIYDLHNFMGTANLNVKVGVIPNIG